MANERIVVVNAPAGSGKTTQIEKQINQKIKNGLNKKILCLTYTNRAVDELKSRIIDEGVDIYTIHSFFQRETKLIFFQKEIISLYIEVFQDRIEADLINTEKIKKYKEKKEIEIENIAIDIIKQNLKKLKYNEKNYSRFLYGELSHDDFLYFINKINCSYEYFKVKINGMYDTIYLDEYQDTNKNILNFLNDIVNYNNSTIIWYLYGDNMQKIYGLENKLEDIYAMNQKINKNFRSSNELIKLLNNIYNQEDYKVEIRENNEYKDYKAKIVLYDENIGIEELKEEGYMNLSSKYDEVFKIIVGNDNKIKKIYENLKREDFKIYGYTADLKASDLLLNVSEWEKDILLHYLKIVFNLKKYFDDNRYGKFINYYRTNKLLNQAKIEVSNHQDRIKVEELMNNKFNNVDFKKNYKEFLEEYKDLFNVDIFEEIEESQINYEDILSELNIEEVWKLFEYIISDEKDFDISTQHGVKGESHYNVNLICEDNEKSKIDYTNFFEVFSKNNIDILKAEKEYEKLKKIENNFFNDIKTSKSKFNAQVFKENEEHCKQLKEDIEKLNLEYGDLFLNPVDITYGTNFKKIFKEIPKYEKYILTFKIFYVGCSRAREKLVVKVPRKVIKNYEKVFIKKMKDLNFEI